MRLNTGDVSLCLNVADVKRSLDYYQRLGFVQVGGELERNWVILRSGTFELGLFQGHIERNLLNFRGADLFALAPELIARGITPDGAPSIEADGSACLSLTDPDGNCLYFNTFEEEGLAFQQRQARPRELCEAIVYVQDMAAQVAFYRDVLGLQVTYPAAAADYAGEFWVTFDTGSCTLALHGGGQGRIGADAPKLVFAVGDIARAKELLHARGLALGEVRSPAPGVLVCDGADPEGNRFSLEQR